METKTLERETENGIIIVNAQNVAHMQGRGGLRRDGGCGNPRIPTGNWNMTRMRMTNELR